MSKKLAQIFPKNGFKKLAQGSPSAASPAPGLPKCSDDLLPARVSPQEIYIKDGNLGQSL